MSIILALIDFVMHIDKHLTYLALTYGTWTYAILFVIVFCETGLVVTPFLPGDSLLFVIGALSASGQLNVIAIAGLLIVAALLGDLTNYHIGKYLGPKVFQREDVKFFKREYLLRTQDFYDRHGRKTIIIARFVPIIRTFAPFVAGIGQMQFFRFVSFSIIGAISWVGLFVTAGYLFGNIEVVKKNFTLVIFAIIFLSILPGIVTYFKEKKRKGRLNEKVKSTL